MYIFQCVIYSGLFRLCDFWISLSTKIRSVFDSSLLLIAPDLLRILLPLFTIACFYPQPFGTICALVSDIIILYPQDIESPIALDEQGIARVKVVNVLGDAVENGGQFYIILNPLICSKYVR